MELTVLQKTAVWILPVILAITVHEVAHGWVADRHGDSTARKAGRLSLNPLRHVDPIGTLLVPGILLLIGGVIFGWARPVPVNWHNLRHPKQDMVRVAVAGPAANLIMAFIWAALFKVAMFFMAPHPWFAIPLAYMAIAGLYINVVLMAINLLPLPPLDGGRVLVGLLPNAMAIRVARLERWGLIILLVMLASGVLAKVVWPIIGLSTGLIAKFTGIAPGLLQNILNSIT